MQADLLAHWIAERWKKKKRLPWKNAQHVSVRYKASYSVTNLTFKFLNYHFSNVNISNQKSGKLFASFSNET